jgi:hypothetical protein
MNSSRLLISLEGRELQIVQTVSGQFRSPWKTCSSEGCGQPNCHEHSQALAVRAVCDDLLYAAMTVPALSSPGVIGNV